MRLQSSLIEIIKEQDGYILAVKGPFRIKIPNEAIKNAIAAASMVRVSGDGDDLAILGTFWDTLSTGISKVQSITNNPLVRTALSVIPYGGAALAAVDAAGAGIALGKKAFAKVPPRTRRLVKRAAKGDPQAKAEVARLKAAAQRGDSSAKAEFNTFVTATRIARDVENIVEYAKGEALPQAELEAKADEG